jgi:hypothetical protein
MVSKIIRNNLATIILATIPFLPGCAALSSDMAKNLGCSPTKQQIREAYNFLVRYEQQPDVIRRGIPIFLNREDKDYIRCLDSIMRNTGSGRIGILFDGEDYLVTDVVY